MIKKCANKQLGMAIIGGILLLSTTGCVSDPRYEEMETLKKHYYDTHSPFGESTDEVWITHENCKEMILYKDFKHVKSVIFEVPYLIGMKRLCSKEDVEKIVQKCGADLTSISLHCCDISAKALKILIEKCPNIIYISISCSKLEEIPEEIVNLKKLEKLWIDQVKFDRIPPVIFKLSGLKDLGIGSNNEPENLKNIKVLPKEIGNLKNLKELTLFGMPLNSLPEEIGNLKNLESIAIGQTGESGLMKLPKSFKNLQNLKDISISNIRLDQIPPVIFELKNLKNLAIGPNELTGVVELTF